jgi:hypothetical protein
MRFLYRSGTKAIDAEHNNVAYRLGVSHERARQQPRNAQNRVQELRVSLRH